MTLDAKIVSTKYASGLWRSFIGERELPHSSFKRLYDAEQVGKSYAENNGLIHRVYSPQGKITKEVDYAIDGSRGGESRLIGNFGQVLEATIERFGGLFSRGKRRKDS